jgi:hypothetical protein
MRFFEISGLSFALVAAACGGAGGVSSPSEPLSPTDPSPADASSPSGSTTLDGGSPSAKDGDALAPSADPTRSGPYAIAELDATARVSATGDEVPIHCAYPAGAGGPFPVVVFAHGFQIGSSLYYGYIRRLASFGYVALTADYPAGFTSVSNVRDAQNLSGALDWAASAPQLAGKATTEERRHGALARGQGGRSRGRARSALRGGARARSGRQQAAARLRRADRVP